MSINFTGRLWRGRKINAVIKQLKTFTFKPVNKMTIQFDPFHEQVKATRDFFFYVSAPKIVRTNPTLKVKTNVVCDRSEPTIHFDLNNGEKVLFKCNHLDVIDILKLYNKHISSLSPPEPDPNPEPVKVKRKQKWQIRIPRHRR